MSRRARATALAAAAGLVVALYPTARRRALTLGATDAEVDGPLPGDDLCPDADLVATRAIDVDAPPELVWPWIAQIGQGRGGFYSYDALENLAGCDIHSADRVEPRWQDVEVGDEIHLHPEFALRIARVEDASVATGSALVLHGAGPVDDDDPVPFDFSWAFVVRPHGMGSSRLLVRERYVYRTGWAGRMVEPVSWVSTVMSERMLRGVRDRAEQSARVA
jgi:hypothetical protein